MTIKPGYPAPVSREYSDLPGVKRPCQLVLIVLAREIPRRGPFPEQFSLSARRRGSFRTSARPGCTSRCPSPVDFPPAPLSGITSQCHQTESPAFSAGIELNALIKSGCHCSEIGQHSCPARRRTAHLPAHRRAGGAAAHSHRLRDRHHV